SSTYDHRVWRTGLPVRSAVLKPHAGRLVVGWVTTSESLLLYVFLLVHLISSIFIFAFWYLSYENLLGPWVSVCFGGGGAPLWENRTVNLPRT
ncbi:hypothetical protein BO94DRAFT_605194, partial [Aspergillus sclerotioniger CBS 115572]